MLPECFRRAAAMLIPATVIACRLGDGASEESSMPPLSAADEAAEPTLLVGLPTDWPAPNELKCHVCHRLLADDPMIQRSRRLSNFHIGLESQHPHLACGACHDDNDHAHLRLIDGTEISFRDCTPLCAQCHAREAEEFESGAHAAMRERIDFRASPRFAAACVDCHAPHSGPMLARQ